MNNSDEKKKPRVILQSRVSNDDITGFIECTSNYYKPLVIPLTYNSTVKDKNSPKHFSGEWFLPYLY